MCRNCCANAALTGSFCAHCFKRNRQAAAQAPVDRGDGR
jgi:hypothetical protein